jgi:hypothetical protein
LASDVEKEDNREVKYAIENAIFTLVGPTILFSLYKHLRDHYGIVPDDVPNHLDVLLETLERTFGVKDAGIIETAIAKRFYFRYGLQFVEVDGHRLQNYIEEAKKRLGPQIR